jgi:branched-chain amino acid transport system permease protein
MICSKVEEADVARKISEVGHSNKDAYVCEHFDRTTRKHLLSVLSNDLISEHRRNPVHMSEPLARLVAWCQRRPLTKQYAVKAEADGSFRLIAFSGVRGHRPTYASEDRYATLEDARHGVLLRHIEDLSGQ